MANEDYIKITLVLIVYLYTSEEIKLRKDVLPEETELINTKLTVDKMYEDILKRIDMKGTSLAIYLKRVRDEIEIIRKRRNVEK